MTHLSERDAWVRGLISTALAEKQSKPKLKESDIQRSIKEYLCGTTGFASRLTR